MAEGRATFGPVVLLGLAAAGLGALAGNRDWVVPDGRDLDAFGVSDTAGQVPLAAALSLVVLACWGVLLVTRGRVRRAVAGLGVLTSAGLLVTVVLGYSGTADSLRDGLATAGSDVGIHHTAWFWVALVAALGCVLTTVAAVRLAPGWPEMGRRYDAPGAAQPPPAEEPLTGIDLWKALDDGRDPTLADRGGEERGGPLD